MAVLLFSKQREMKAKLVEFVKTHKWQSVIALFILSLFLVYLVNSLTTFKEASIEKVVSKEKNVVKAKIDQQKQEVSEFKESQKDKVEQAKQILKKRKHGTPKIKRNNHNAMLDSLWIAQPDI